MRLSQIRLRDPFILPENGVYYLYGSEVVDQKKFMVYKSHDLIEWSEPKVILEANAEFDYDKFWAPEVHKYKGKYYLFASFETEYTRILECDTPDGIYKPIAPPPVRDGVQHIDGTFYVDKKGQPYIAVSYNKDIYKEGRWYIKEASIQALPLSQDLKEPAGELFPLIYGDEYFRSRTRLVFSNLWHVTEGPFFYRTDENLYLLWSGFSGEHNGQQAYHTYFQAVAKSDNGEIDGNWVYQDELLYADDGGHGMIFEDFDGNPKLILHQPNGVYNEETPCIFDIVEKNGKLIIKD